MTQATLSAAFPDLAPKIPIYHHFALLLQRKRRLHYRLLLRLLLGLFFPVRSAVIVLSVSPFCLSLSFLSPVPIPGFYFCLFCYLCSSRPPHDVLPFRFPLSHLVLPLLSPGFISPHRLHTSFVSLKEQRYLVRLVPAPPSFPRVYIQKANVSNPPNLAAAYQDLERYTSSPPSTWVSPSRSCSTDYGVERKCGF